MLPYYSTFVPTSADVITQLSNRTATERWRLTDQSVHVLITVAVDSMHLHTLIIYAGVRVQ